MAKASEQFRQSDVTTWGIVALVLAAIAVMGANVSAMVPQSVLAGLHKTRIEGASLTQLRSQVADLRLQMQELHRENGVLTARFNLGEEQSGEVVRRVGALEVSVPNLLELSPRSSGVDRSSLTSAIGTDAGTEFEAEGGSVLVRQQPMAELAPPVPSQPIPAPVQQAATPASATTFGLALGPAIGAEQASETWRDLNVKLGPLLFGLAPVLADESNGTKKRLVVGPIAQLAEASALCGRLERVSVACMPVPFTGTPLDY
ncbi:hypothetical protein [Devosia sp. YR412]|uniref:hypothetical protein n=1 Tax=Devosia sp. YR412 TaxID=1881030 RepID=UPI0011139865|nr:hypothetical protein [Devosia sp. YR412]